MGRYASKTGTAWRTPGVLASLLWQLRTQRSFLRQHIQPVLDDTLLHNDGSIDDKDIKKINHYYGLAAPAIVGEAFCILQGRPVSKDERMASTCQGAMTGLFDDLFDQHSISEEHLHDLVHNPGSATPANTHEQLFLHFYKEMLRQVPDPAEATAQLVKVGQSQQESKKQENAGITTEEIENITLDKGGQSLIFYRMAFNDRICVSEMEMLMQLGGLIQLSNDIFDVYKDLQQGIHTLATQTRDIRQLRDYYSAWINRFRDMVMQSGYHRYRAVLFIERFSIAVFSRCFVCLDQFEKLQRQSGGIFNPQLYERGQLVCDMDTGGNKRRSVMAHIFH